MVHWRLLLLRIVAIAGKLQVADPGKEGGFYVEGLDPAEIRAMAVASTMSGTDQEIALLRVLIRHAVTLGDVDQVRRCLETLSHLVAQKHKLSQADEGELSQGLGRVLDILGEELGEKL